MGRKVLALNLKVEESASIFYRPSRSRRATTFRFPINILTDLFNKDSLLPSSKGKAKEEELVDLIGLFKRLFQSNRRPFQVNKSSTPRFFELFGFRRL